MGKERYFYMLNKKLTKIAIVGSSNAQKKYWKTNLERLVEILNQRCNMQCQISEYLFEDDNYFGGSGRERGEEINRFFRDESIDAIFDISGGDIANEILPYLDYEEIRRSPKPYFGYSDVSTVLNAIYAKTGVHTCNYQLRNLIYEQEEKQITDFNKTFRDGENDLFHIRVQFVQGSYMKGSVIGGNIRCFLKLAGTEYMPCFDDKILLLEALNASSWQVATYLAQLKQLGAFDKINGILLGTFTKLDAELGVPCVEELIQRYAGKDMPVARTYDIGHGADAKAIWIGKEVEYKKK